MAGFTPDKVPVLSTLALEFRGVPALVLVGARRDLAEPQLLPRPRRHRAAPTSSSASTKTAPSSRTSTANGASVPRPDRAWHVYYGQFPPQVFFFTYVLERSIDHTGGLQDLLDDIDHGRLPAYSFVEPHHGLLGRQPSCSQHPGNNLTARAGGVDSRSGERLVAEIYRHLQQHPDVFDKTVFVVTYDEHGSLPTTTTRPARGRTRVRARHLVSPTHALAVGTALSRRLRLPAPRATRARRGHLAVDPAGNPRQHRAGPFGSSGDRAGLFAPTAGFLTRRDRQAATFESLLTLDQPRRAPELPTLDDELHTLGNPPLFPGDPSLPPDAPAPPAPSSTFDWQLVDLTHAIHTGTVTPPRRTLRVPGPRCTRDRPAPRPRCCAGVVSGRSAANGSTPRTPARLINSSPTPRPRSAPWPPKPAQPDRRHHDHRPDPGHGLDVHHGAGAGA